MLRKTPELRFSEFKDNWEEKTLGEISNNFSYGLNLPSMEYDGENKYLRITDIDEDTNNFIESSKTSPCGKFDKTFLLEEGDILFARTGASVGKTYYYKNSDGKMYFAGFLIRAKIKKKNSYKFIFYNTLTERYNRWVKTMSVRSGQPGINVKEYSSFKVNLPSLPEQEKIASFFSTIDRKIELQEEKTDSLEEYKKGIMQKIFSQEIRFKKENGENYPDWEEKELRNISDRVTRKNKLNISKRPLTISADLGLIDQEEYFKKRIASKDIEGYYVLKKSEFAYNKSYSKGYPFGAIKRLTRYDNGVVSTLYICFKIKEGNCKRYIEKYFDSSKWHNEIAKIAVEGARNHGLLNILVEDFFGIKIDLPSLPEQEKIASFLSTLDSKIELEKERLEYLKEFKKGLMQKMFI